jgi:hypothetical protein
MIGAIAGDIIGTLHVIFPGNIDELVKRSFEAPDG